MHFNLFAYPYSNSSYYPHIQIALINHLFKQLAQTQNQLSIYARLGLEKIKPLQQNALTFWISLTHLPDILQQVPLPSPLPESWRPERLTSNTGARMYS